MWPALTKPGPGSRLSTIYGMIIFITRFFYHFDFNSVPTKELLIFIKLSINSN